MDRSPGDARRDRGLLRRVADGDSQALAELYDLHAERLHFHALSLSRRVQDAEDTVQAVFVKLAGMGAELLSIRNPAAYLHKMARTRALETLRGVERRAELPLATGALLVSDLSGCSAAEASLLAQRIAELPAEQRECLVLHIYGGFTFREIGRIAGVSGFTAASRYRLALARLRKECGA